MKVSVLIVSWNTRELLGRCIESILTQKPPFSFEVIVVDNASSDGSAEFVREQFDSHANIRLIEAADNLGFARANNVALKEASGEYIFLLNPDTEIRGDAILKLANYLDRHEEVGIVGPKLLSADGTIQPSVRRFPDFWGSLLVIAGLHRILRPKKYFMDEFDYSREAEVDQVMGAALMTRRAITDQLGLFDEQFWLWYEEVDFCRRVIAAGYKVYYYPDSVVMHRGAESFSQLNVFARKKAAGRSLVYYFRKNHGLFLALAMQAAVAILLGIALLMALLQKLAGFRSRPHGI